MTPQQFQNLKDRSLEQRFETPAERISKLQKLENWIRDNEAGIHSALKKDFNKPVFETDISEILPCLSEISFYKKNLKKWMKEKSVPTPLSLFGYRSRIRYENKGVVLIIAPWNYPFQLAIAPMIDALGAGNTVVIKPSELTPATSNLILRLAKECFPENEVIVELGAKEKTEELLCYAFDHVFFTGSTAVGRVIAKACAERLIPTTLELGGKSPTIVDETCDLLDAAEKIFWGKFLNRGQTCIAPDYLIVHESIKAELEKRLNALKEKNQTAEKAAIISERHVDRLQHLNSTPESVKESPLILETNVPPQSAVMKEEIFGPLAPIFSYRDEKEILNLIRQNDTPLSLYIFSKRKDFIERMLKQIPSGGAGINALLVHFANHHLPFGGLGASGLGRYHGHHGFLELSHPRGVIEQKFFSRLRFAFLPPYTNSKSKMVNLFKRL